ncbi:MAG: metalloregulator ArsR/SmtB family transcription factor [Boseongicola sp.]|nr:MAG: metalloregulator ArsR/SmtB family transcription factor [Boseongicola sp.]
MLSTTFAALGDPTRLAIVETLLADGEKSAGELVEQSSVSAPAVSRHLKVLTEAGLINRRTEQQRRIYSVNRDGMGQISDWLQLHITFWEGSIDRLQAAVEKEDFT